MSLKGALASRRGFLGSVAVGVLGGLAGCLGDGNDTGGPSSSPTDEDDSSNTGPETVVKTAPSGDSSTDTPTETPDQSEEKEPLSPSFRTESGTTGYGIELVGSPVMAETSDPPIDIYYWYDYQCEFCKQFEMSENGALPKLIRNEVADGSARIVLLYYPNYGDHSWTAGVMANCLWQQVKDNDPNLFWEWHHAVFDNQGLDGGNWSSRSSLLDYTRNIEGIDARSLDQCMQQNRKQHEKKIKAERKRARDEGISDTPGFVLYHPESDRSTSFFGAQPYSTFQQQIKAYLNL